MHKGTSLTFDQILALAPDAASAKASKEQASLRKWSQLGRNEVAAWGFCQGSAKDPYQTQIDLSTPAFRCTCPSRKHPCKHAIGLFLLLAGNAGAFQVTAPPAWAAEWLEARQQRAEKGSKPKDEMKAIDPKARAKRAARREANVREGIEDLDLWLRDLVRQGLAMAANQPASYWETPAARLVDSQAPGLARRLREMAQIVGSGDGWQARLLEQAAQLYLLTQGLKRIEQLPPETQTDLRTLAGWSQNQEELLQQDGLRDRWLVLGQRVEEESPHLLTTRTWLWGRQSGRAALILHFAPPGGSLDSTLAAGTELEASLAFFPGAYPLRALVKSRFSAPIPLEDMPGYAGWLDLYEAYTIALATNPWVSPFPAPLQNVIPLYSDGQWILSDNAGKIAPLARQFTSGWELTAASGGHPVSCFGEWDGEHFLPMGCLAAGQWTVWS